MSGKSHNESSDTDARILPVQFTGTPDSHDEPDAEGASTIKRMGISAISIVLFFVVISVIFVLPRYVQPTPPVANVANETPTEHTTENDLASRPAQTLQPAETAELRRTNQAQLEQALVLVEELKSRNVSAWANKDFSAAQAQIELGEKAYREQRYNHAQKFYASAIEALKATLARTDSVVADAVDDGFLQIDSRDSAAAKKAFKFALSIDPDHEQATKGLARAQTLDQVLALINEAEGFEALGDLDAALTRYGEAVALDNQAPGGSSAIARVKQIQLDTEFRRVMSKGFAAYDAKNDQDAKAAFERAKKLKPHATEATEALAQVENRILANKISQRLSRAISFAQQEKWTESAEQYRAAVSLDSDLDGAAASAKTADARAKLDRQLNSFIGRPHRLNTEAVYKEAQSVLERARSVAAAGPRLTRQIKALDQAIVVARTPIAVTLVSDNATEVILYNVGPLGHFEQHSVKIIPGRYVVVGRRDGFQDVRVEFDVSPEHRNAMITVQCEQKLAFGS